MAILEDCPGVEVNVLVEGSALPEYECEDEMATNIVVNYIEARSSTDFAIQVKFREPFPGNHSVQVATNIDGSHRRLTLLESHELYQPEGFLKNGSSFMIDGRWFKRNYRFTALEIVEDVAEGTDLPILRKDVEAKGCIEISLRHVTNVRQTRSQHRSTSMGDLAVMGAIPEKALKGDALSHQATLGKPHPSQGKRSRKMYDMVDQKPFATFRFKYRSRSALEALHVLPKVEDSAVLERRTEESQVAQIAEQMQQEAWRGPNQGTVKREYNNTAAVKRERTSVSVLGDDDDVIFVESRSRKQRKVEKEVMVLD